MKVKIFSFKKPYFSMWSIPVDSMQNEIENWLLKNPNATIEEIRHDRFHGIWYAPQLVVTIYYTD